MGFDLGDLTKIPTDEELVAQALGKIEGELKHLDDPDIWSRDDESPGLLMLLEDCVASEYYGRLASPLTSAWRRYSTRSIRPP